MGRELPKKSTNLPGPCVQDMQQSHTFYQSEIPVRHFMIWWGGTRDNIPPGWALMNGVENSLSNGGGGWAAVGKAWMYDLNEFHIDDSGSDRAGVV